MKKQSNPLPNIDKPSPPPAPPTASQKMIQRYIDEGFIPLPNWRERFKDIDKGESMPQTPEYWEARAQMDQELILEQRKEINKLKFKLNQLQQRNR